MKRCVTLPELTAVNSSLKKIPSNPQLRQVKSQASLVTEPLLNKTESYGENLVIAVSEVVRDIGDPRGIASVICLERAPDVQHEIFQQKLTAESAELQGCLRIPTEEEEASCAESVWKNVIDADVDKTRDNYRDRKRKWQRIVQK